MGPVAGLSGTAMVIKDGSVQADLAAGLADAEAGVPCASQTRFQLSNTAGLPHWLEAPGLDPGTPCTPSASPNAANGRSN